MERRLLHVDAHGPRFDEGALAVGHHQLVPQLRRELAQEEERDEDHAQADQARDDELVLPRREVAQRVRGHQAGRQGTHGGTERPEPHRDAATHLRREVAHQRRRRDQDDALYEADHAVGGGEPELVGDVRDGEELNDRNDKGPVDREVGSADLVGEPADERAERPDGVRDHQQVQEELEGHVVVGQQQRGDGALHVVEVIEHDRRQHDDRQVPEPRPRVGVLVELSPPEGIRQAVLAGDRCGHRSRGHVRSPFPRSARPMPPSVPPRTGRGVGRSPDARATSKRLNGPRTRCRHRPDPACLEPLSRHAPREDF